jgi:hypothetical protein
LSRGTSASELLQAASSGACISSIDSELSSYLDSDTLQKFEDDFNLLNWWHEHKLTFPVLSILARDVISVHVSTVLLGPCFVAEGPAGRNSFGKSCLYVMPKLPLMKLRCYSVSEDEGSNRLKDGMTF